MTATDRFARRAAGSTGQGVFASAPITAGELLFEIAGQILATADLTDDMRALQIGTDLWIASDGQSLDDDVNHSCEPNAGFIHGTPLLVALRAIAVGEEITWDYSTSISEPGWSLECLCGAESCRRTVRPWGELSQSDRDRLRPIALDYLRCMH
jgi:hypothetical protein